MKFDWWISIKGRGDSDLEGGSPVSESIKAVMRAVILIPFLSGRLTFFCPFGLHRLLLQLPSQFNASCNMLYSKTLRWPLVCTWCAEPISMWNRVAYVVTRLRGISWAPFLPILLSYVITVGWGKIARLRFWIWFVWHHLARSHPWGDWIASAMVVWWESRGDVVDDNSNWSANRSARNSSEC